MSNAEPWEMRLAGAAGRDRAAARRVGKGCGMTREDWRDVVIEAVRRHDDGTDHTLLDLTAAVLAEQERAKQVLRDKGYGCTGMGIERTAREVPQMRVPLVWRSAADPNEVFIRCRGGAFLQVWWGCSWRLLVGVRGRSIPDDDNRAWMIGAGPFRLQLYRDRKVQ